MIHQRTRRSIVLDDHEEFSEGVRIRRFADLVDYLCRNADKPFRILYTSPELSREPDEPGSEFNRLCEFLFHIPDHCLVLNEVSLFSSCTQMPDGLRHLITQGRREFIDIVATVRRKTETHNILTSQANVLVSFRQILPEDINYMKSFIGPEADKIPSLAEHEFIYFNGKECGRDKLDFKSPGKLEFFKKIDLNGGFC